MLKSVLLLYSTMLNGDEYIYGKKRSQTCRANAAIRSRRTGDLLSLGEVGDEDEGDIRLQRKLDRM
jgi:hypothetical protein